MSYRMRMRCDETKIEQFVTPAEINPPKNPVPSAASTQVLPKIKKHLARNSFTTGTDRYSALQYNTGHITPINTALNPSTSLTTEQTKQQKYTHHKAIAIERSQSQVTQRSKLYDTSSKGPRRSCDVPLRANRIVDVDHSLAQFTLILMGAPMVGKSTLVNQFLWEIFLREYRPTVEEFNWVEYDTKSQKKAQNGTGNMVTNRSSESSTESLLLQIIDSAGSRDFLAMRYLYYKIGDAFMVTYALNDSNSYTEALLMIQEIQQKNSKKAPILLVANKLDCYKESLNLMKPSLEEMNQFCAISRVEWICISAKNLEQVKNAFWRLIEDLAHQRHMGHSTNEIHLQKRRQSMPSRRTANELGFDEETLERLVRKHESTRANCTIS